MAILESGAKTGVSWVKESIALFRLQPSKWLLLALAYIGIFMMLPSLPGLGFFALLTVLIWPVFTAFAVMLFRNAELGKSETIQQTFAHVKPSLPVLISLGLACLVYATLISFVLNADVQSLIPFAQNKAPMDETKAMLFMQKLMPLMFKLLLLLIPLLISTWFSPMLIVINRYSLVKAIKSSIAGALQYTVAMGAAWLLLSAGIMLFMLVAGLLIGILAQILPFLAQTLMPTFIFGVLLVATALMFAFQYVTYRDIFRAATVEI
ncbi:MAG: BPSS1780 family membrane protein [Methylophilus sp.]|jgi:hypothetical protein